MLGLALRQIPKAKVSVLNSSVFKSHRRSKIRMRHVAWLGVCFSNWYLNEKMASSTNIGL